MCVISSYFVRFGSKYEFTDICCHRGCPSNAISDNCLTQSYVNNLEVEWHINLLMAPWHSSFFEGLV